MLAYCGINCQECRAYRGTVNSDLSLLKKSAGESYRQGQHKAEDWVCLGCTPANQKFIAKYCLECTVRKCAVEKGVQNCAECTDYDGCHILHEIMEEYAEGSDTNELRIRMDLLRKRYLDSNQ